MNKVRKQMGISVLYNLPDNWQEETSFSFDHLSELVLQLHDSAYSATVKAINRFATIRNYVIGFYIVEYEQHGNDRAKYGDRLLKRLAESVNKRGINETILKNCRRFYLAYPQIKDYLTAISPTASEKSLGKSPTASDKSSQISPTASDNFITPAAELVSKLSFSHIVEILTIEDPLARFFYETECIRCCWSVNELRRQISTNLYFRAGVSQKPELLLERTEINTSPAITICFEARQKRMIIDDEYYFADLVFYNRILHCNVIIELKDDEFRHADLSQLNAYVSYFRENEMNLGENPPVGILLCTRKGDKMVEYALAGMDNDLFVSTYMLSLPDKKALQEFLLKEIEK